MEAVSIICLIICVIGVPLWAGFWLGFKSRDIEVKQLKKYLDDIYKSSNRT